MGVWLKKQVIVAKIVWLKFKKYTVLMYLDFRIAVLQICSEIVGRS